MSTFGRYRLPIQRIDTFRYVLMATVGGMYADLDNECLSPPELPGANRSTGGCKAYVATQACTDTFLQRRPSRGRPPSALDRCTALACWASLRYPARACSPRSAA